MMIHFLVPSLTIMNVFSMSFFNLTFPPSVSPPEELPPPALFVPKPRYLKSRSYKTRYSYRTRFRNSDYIVQRISLVSVLSPSQTGAYFTLSPSLLLYPNSRPIRSGTYSTSPHRNCQIYEEGSFCTSAYYSRKLWFDTAVKTF